MDGRLANKVIIVAGAGGIGSELARRYAAEGASVVLGDLNGDAAADTAADIIAAGGHAIGLQLDGSDEDSIKAAVERAVFTFGGLDGFHANFANFSDGETGADVLGLPLDVYDETMRVNARGFFLCTRHAVPAMIENGGGSMVYTSSGGAHQPMPIRAAYAMSKAASHALMRHVATRFGPSGIRANAIAPGATVHSRFKDVIPKDVMDQMMQSTALKTRLGAPEDIAAMGALLMSDEGSFITGQVISVDGGGSMRP